MLEMNSTTKLYKAVKNQQVFIKFIWLHFPSDLKMIGESTKMDRAGVKEASRGVSGNKLKQHCNSNVLFWNV